MSKVIFFNIPAHGHTNPTLALVKELVGRGEEVIYYSFGEFRNKIEQTGAKFRDYGVDISGLVPSKMAAFPLLFHTLMKFTYSIMNKLISAIKNEKPDYIIHDSLCPWAKYCAEILNIPAVSSITTFVYTKESLKLTKGLLTALPLFFLFGLKNLVKGFAIQNRIVKEYHAEKQGLFDIFLNRENLNIVYTSRDFQPHGSLLDDSFKFVGPSIIERKEKNDITLPESNTQPLVYISLGTVMNLNIDFYTICFQALSDMKILVVMSAGTTIELSIFKNTPPNFIIRNYVSQLEILSKSDIFITHGGMNSVHEGLFYEVPMIVVPQQKEQAAVAERIETTNTGIFLRKINTKTIKESVTKILTNKSYKANSIKMGESLRSAGGFMKAADEIILFKNHYLNRHQ